MNVLRGLRFGAAGAGMAALLVATTACAGAPGGRPTIVVDMAGPNCADPARAVFLVITSGDQLASKDVEVLVYVLDDNGDPQGKATRKSPQRGSPDTYPVEVPVGELRGVVVGAVGRHGHGQLISLANTCSNALRLGDLTAVLSSAVYCLPQQDKRTVEVKNVGTAALEVTVSVDGAQTDKATIPAGGSHAFSFSIPPGGIRTFALNVGGEQRPFPPAKYGCG
jgi:hypothetical protein